MVLILGNNKTWNSPRVSYRPLAFHKYINDLPPTIKNLSKHIIFADDINVIIASKDFDDFCTTSSIFLSHMSKWFTAKKLALNLDKTN